MASLMPLQRSVTPWKVSRMACDDVTTMTLSCRSDPHVCSDSSSDSTLQSGRVHVHSGPDRTSAHLPAQR